MAVALSESNFAKLSPEARAQLGGARVTKTVEKPVTTARTKPLPTPRYGASERTRAAANTTRRAFRASGSGRVNATPRGVLWAFVWIGVFGYLLAHPATLPRIVQLVFAPVNGVMQVAHGKNVNLAQHPAS